VLEVKLLLTMRKKETEFSTVDLAKLSMCRTQVKIQITSSCAGGKDKLSSLLDQVRNS